jgi:PAS domain S-box-containing protein
MTNPTLPVLAQEPASAERYQSLVSNIRDYAILMLDVDGNVISWNEGAEAIKGYAAHEIIGTHFSRFYPPETIASRLPWHELEVATATGRFEDEGWRVRKDGTRFWANVVITRMLDKAGLVVGFSKITRDLTQRRNDEVALRQSEERFRLLIAGVKDYAIFMLDPQGRVATWNAGAEAIKGYTASDIIGSHFSRFYPPEAIDRKLPEAELRGATLEGRYEDEGYRIRKDGTRFWANVIITAVRNPAGQLIGFSKITRDLTERRAHEDNLRLSEERFRLLVDGVTEYAILMLDDEGFVSSWNLGAERIKGYKAAEIIGRHISHFYPSEEIVGNKPWMDLRTARSEGRVASEGWRVRKDRTLFWANSIITALKDSEGRPYGFAQVMQDLTQRRQAETMADTAQRMHEFIAMLAHELRNPLAPIRNAVALMGKVGLANPTLEAMRQTIDRQSILLTRLLDDLLDVNRIARGNFAIEKTVLDLRTVITRAIETSRPMIEANSHALDVKMPAKEVRVVGDSVRLTQAVVNLINNAAKYTPVGGKILIELRLRSGDAEIRVSDNGRGIAPDMLERVFELFVQVEPMQHGSIGGLGVGLALVRRVIELHGGSIQAHSEGLGNGAEFIARIPVSTEALGAGDEAEQAPQNKIAALRVLVIDDNHDSADTLAMLLQAMGQIVSTAYDGAAALSVAQSLRPNLIFLDIGMPNMSGYEVARAIRAMYWDKPPVLVAVTGWGQEADRERAAEAGFDRHFVKPVSEDGLREVLEQALAARS